jgi:hypothetical protein
MLTALHADQCPARPPDGIAALLPLSGYPNVLERRRTLIP